MFDRPHRLHPAAIIINAGAYLIRSVKAMAAPIIALLASGGRHGGHLTLLMIGLFVTLIGVFPVVGSVLHFFSTTYYIEGDALIVSSGFIWRKRRTIPLARIQNVNVERSIWHRILGAASVKVETAAGHKHEGDLTALSIVDANNLQTILLQRHGADAIPAETEKPSPIYSLSLKQVLLAGALENRVIYIIAGVFSVFQFDRSDTFFRPVIHYMNGLSPMAALVAGALLTVVLILVGWIVSIVMSAARFYGFRIDKHERGLLLTHGLITQFRTIVPIGRIQSIRIVEPILFRLLGYCEVYADTAGSFDKKDVASANKVCPLVHEAEVSGIGKRLLAEFEFERLSWQPVSAKTVGRHAFRYFFTFVVLLSWPLGHWMHWNSLWLLLPLGLYCWLLGVVYYRYVAYSFTNDILVSRSGIFRKRATIIPFDRIQHYTINATFFQRIAGLATVTAVSASTGGHAVHITDVDAASVERLRQTISDAIRTHLGSRRGGL